LQETRLILIRHAETSAPDVFHGAESDVSLSEWGSHQARQLAAVVKEQGPQALYCSAMRRAIATAEPVAEACGLAPKIIPELHERKIGPLSGLSREDGWHTYAQSKKEWTSGNLDFTHEGGESFADIRRRVLPIVEGIALRHRGQTTVVIAHGIVIRVLLLSLLPHLRPSDFDRIAIDFASINDLRHDGQTWRAHALNQLVAPSPAKPVA
jgi:broad specificity phosphatase PhoE